MRDIDYQYQNLLKTVIETGEWQETRQGPRSIVVLGQTMRFDLAQCFPLITERDISFWPKAIGELVGFINGARTLEELREYGCDWWGPWGSEKKCAKRGLETGDIGPGSYGDVFANFPGPDGQTFDQWPALVDQIKQHPFVKTHVITNWLAGHLTRANGHQPTPTIAPCHGNVQVTILGERLHLEMVQRSGDVPVGVPANMVQYAAIQLALCYLTGYKPGTFIHHIRNAHIYENQMESAHEMVYNRTPRPLPRMLFAGNPNTIKDVDYRDFIVAGYNPNPAIKGIPVAT